MAQVFATPAAESDSPQAPPQADLKKPPRPKRPKRPQTAPAPKYRTGPLIGYTMVPRWPLRSRVFRTLTWVERDTYYALCDHRDQETWYSRPPIGQLQDETGHGEHQIRAALNTLVRNGLIREIGKKRRYEGVTYRIVRQPPPALTERVRAQASSPYRKGKGSALTETVRVGEREGKGESEGEKGESEIPRHPSGARGDTSHSPSSSRSGALPTQNVEVIRAVKRWLRSFNTYLAVPPDKHYKITGKYGPKIVTAWRVARDQHGYAEDQLFALIPRAAAAYDAGEGLRKYYCPWVVLEEAAVLLAGIEPAEAPGDDE